MSISDTDNEFADFLEKGFEVRFEKGVLTLLVKIGEFMKEHMDSKIDFKDVVELSEHVLEERAAVQSIEYPMLRNAVFKDKP